MKNNSEDSDSDSNEYVDHKRSSSLVNSDKEEASICQVTEQIKKLGLPNFSSETNAYIQSDDFWNEKTSSDAQITFIRELAEFYYFKLERPFSVKLSIKTYEFIIGSLMDKYEKLKECIINVKNETNKKVVQGLHGDRQRVFRSCVLIIYIYKSILDLISIF